MKSVLVFIPALIIVAVVFYLIGDSFFRRDFERDKAINRIRINSHADKPHKELKRIPSPDGRVDAILSEVGIDALNPNGYAVYLVPVGEQLDLGSIYPDRKVFYANRINDLEVGWREPKYLEIKYTNGDIFEFQNNWILEKEYLVEIRIVPLNIHSLSR